MRFLPARTTDADRLGARVALAAALAVALGIYSGIAERLPNLGDVPDAALLSFVLFPAWFAFPWLLAPLRGRLTKTTLIAVAAVLVGLSFLLHYLDVEFLANLARLLGCMALGWWILTFFDVAAGLVLVALLVVPIDILSLRAGPSSVLVSDEDRFAYFSLGFKVPGEEAAAFLGLPDLIFFSLFFAAAQRFDLRRVATWLVMVGSFGVVLTTALLLDLEALPGLVLLAIGFLVVNADRLVADAKALRANAAR